MKKLAIILIIAAICMPIFASGAAEAAAPAGRRLFSNEP